MREPYGRALGMGLAGMLSFQMGYSLLMSLGIVPIMGIPFPFLSIGSSHIIIEMAVMGPTS
ncbi:FtsW/RodA/SpoVE family cell cycle protein [Paenibacillus glacialis]|uniref:FtsW/RodA/SpoVE family cell cycle protein n=1 Tax=Paenibacillus glacialis TaxID=494026 RepID=UPI0013732AAC|nr:FtsW/RodA/SpoVE family cell cycle protein [Paenibacillus glacialis]